MDFCFDSLPGVILKCIHLTKSFFVFIFVLPFQNLVLPECFFSFVDLKKEFQKCCPNAGPVQQQDLTSMLECILGCTLRCIS